MPPAARLGDQTAHGVPLAPGPGSSTVIVGGMPAWRVGDTFTCPLSTGPVPHGGGIVSMGSTTVLIEGLPAARVGDPIQEATAPNTIVGGEPTVLIG